jgi:hypothetical protein
MNLERPAAPRRCPGRRPGHRRGSANEAFGDRDRPADAGTGRRYLKDALASPPVTSAFGGAAVMRRRALRPPRL